MAWKGFTGGVANLQPASFSAVFIKTGSEKWQTLGAISGGVLNVKDFTSPDSKARNKAINSYDFTSKCKMMQASLIELQLLSYIVDGTNDFLFKLPDAVTPAGAASSGWVKVTSSQVGCKANIVGDGDPSNPRSIDLEFQGSIYKSDANETALYKPTLAAADFGSTAVSGTYMGTLGVGGIGSYTATLDGGLPNNGHIVPSGVLSVTLDGAGLSSPDTITPIQNVKLSIKTLAAQDGIRRFLPNSLEIDIAYDWMATGNADLLLLGNASLADIKTVMVLTDGVTLTLDNKTGIETNFEVSGDMDKNRVVRITHAGKDLLGSLGGLFG